MITNSQTLSKLPYRVWFLLSLLLISSIALGEEADFAQCRQFFVNGNPPVMHMQRDMQTRALCFDAFAVLHSGKSRTPIYVAERLNRAIIEIEVGRVDQFYEEARLPISERAHLEDYRDSGFDRGHMAPAADMSTLGAMAQSFSLANVIPQAPINNRKAWAKIESDTRKYVMRAAGDVYVITGPAFDTNPATIGNSKVWVPSQLFKMVYDPSSKRAWTYWLDNSDEARLGKPISYAELVERTGIDFLPQ